MLYPGQTTAIEQYPNSGMNIPQIDAIRRARAGSTKPLYSAAEDVMGGAQAQGAQLQGQMGGIKPAMEGPPGFGAKPGVDQRMAQFGRMRPEGMRKPMAEQIGGTKPMRVGAPSGRGMPGIPGPAPRVRETF